MTTTMETCTFCCGKKVAERFEQRIGDEWQPENRRSSGTWNMPEPDRTEFRDKVAQSHPELFRWATVDCPRCNGAGEYWIEHFTCKVY